MLVAHIGEVFGVEGFERIETLDFLQADDIGIEAADRVGHRSELVGWLRTQTVAAAVHVIESPFERGVVHIVKEVQDVVRRQSHSPVGLRGRFGEAHSRGRSFRGLRNPRALGHARRSRGEAEQQNERTENGQLRARHGSSPGGMRFQGSRV